MDLDALATLEPATLRTLLPAFLAGHLDDPEAADRNRERMSALVADWDDATCRSLVAHLAALGDGIQVFEPHPAARELSRAWCRDVLLDPHLDGEAHLAEAAATGRPVVVICNHRSYLDSTAIDAVLAWAGHRDVADALVSLAGPKVYADAFRRVATACLATLPVPQSTQLAHTADLPPRELARRAIRALRAGREALASGRHLLVYPEGARSRDGRLGPFLPGVARYLDQDETIVVPAALVGTEARMPVGRTALLPGTLSLRFGAPLPVSEHGGPRAVLERAHQAVADLLPPDATPA